jgi:hypothetical protein
VLDLLLPYALNDIGRLVAWWSGASGARYVCPSCGADCLWRRASVDKSGVLVRRSHFAHTSDTSCAGESLTHMTAKRLVCQQLSDWASGVSRRPVVESTCRCGRPREPYPCPALMSAELEAAAPFGSYVADILALLQDGRRGAVEVAHTHRMGEEKTSAYNAGLAWWLEVAAGPLLEDPPRWVCLAKGGDVPGSNWRCQECCEADRRRLDELVRAGAEAKESVAKLARMHDQAEADKAMLASSAAKAGVAVERTMLQLQRYRDEVEVVRAKLLDVTSQLVSAETRLNATLFATESDESQKSRLKLLDLRNLEAMYRQEFDACERLRLRSVSLSRKVAALESRLGTRPTEPTT